MGDGNIIFDANLYHGVDRKGTNLSSNIKTFCKFSVKISFEVNI